MKHSPSNVQHLAITRSHLSQVKSIWTRETHTLAASSESLDSSLQEDLRIGLYEGAGTLSFFTLDLAAYRFLSSAVDDPNTRDLRTTTPRR